MNFSFFPVYLLALAGWALTDAKGACRISFHIEDDPLILNLSDYTECMVKITTAEDRVIAFHHVEGPIADLRDYIKILNGLELQTDYIPLEKVNNEEMSRLNVNYDKTVYSTGTGAILIIDSIIPSSGLHLKISKAVNCPFNLGTESQCGRIVNDLSCYCATFTKRNWGDQNNYCTRNGFKFLAIESPAEESAIYAAWGREIVFWMSLNDIATDGVWKWDSTGQNLYPGYANWETGQPDDSYIGGEDCAGLNWIANGGWNDFKCTHTYDAICEIHP